MSVMTTARIGIVCVMTLTGTALAQTTAPTTQATTQAAGPTSRPFDQSSPQGALKVFTVAAREGNGEAIRGVLYPENEKEQAIAEIISNRVVAAVALQNAAARFPGQALNPAELDKAMANAFNDIDSAEVKVDGDSATLTTISREPGVPGSSIPFKRKDGKWGMLMTSMVSPLSADPKEFESRVTRAKIETEVIREVAVEIAAGKYNALDEAGRVLQTRVQTQFEKWQTEKAKSTTQPVTTRGTTQPAEGTTQP